MKKNSVPESPITDEEEGEIPATTAEGEEPPRGRRLMVASLGALGVVYGDIGTSPLYALRECFSGGYGVRISEANILGLLSLVFWSLLLIIAIKYLVLVMEADNRGEGGILALMALVREKGAAVIEPSRCSLRSDCLDRLCSMATL
jgi:KUP system potassium uptake protein